jgi:hypothetical protein
VIKSTLNETVNLRDLSPIKLALALFHSFKPNTDPYKNLLYHIQTESQMRTLEQLAEEDQ